MPAASYDRADIRTLVGTEMGDPTFKHFTSTILNGLINDAMGDWCEATKLRRVNGTIDIVANTSVYSLSSLSPRVIEIIRASCPTSSSATDDRPLTLVTVQDLDEPTSDHYHPNWRSDNADWPRYVIRATEGPQSLRLYPTPASSQEATVREGTLYASQETGVLLDITGLTSTAATAEVGALIGVQFLVGSLQLYYIAHSTDLSDDSTTVETACGISPDFQDALVWYVCARCCEMGKPISQANDAATYWAKWADEVKRASGLAMGGMQRRPSRQVKWSNV